MARMEFRAITSADRQSVTIELWMDGRALGHMVLDAATLEGHIRDLARHRAELADEVPEELEPRARIEGVQDPIWRLGESADDLALALRHPGLGWLSFQFPRNEAAALGRELVARTAPQSEDDSSDQS
jgi:hypothetical protein